MYTFNLFLFLMSIIKSDAKAAMDISIKNDKIDYKYYTGVGWVHYNPIPMQWTEARLQCFYEGAELMSPVNEEMTKIMSEIGGTAVIWTGVHATYSKGNYFSINGVPLSAMPIKWAQDEPNNENNNENCMIMLPGGNMADCSCNETYAFSCYKPNNFKTLQCGTISGYEFNRRTQNCYKFHTYAQNWNTAFMICAAEGAHLAVIDTPGEQKVLRDIFNNYPPNLIHNADFTTHIQLGFSDWQNHQLWMTINGKNIDDLVNDEISAWANGEPNNVMEQNEYCGSMTRDGMLNDSPCHVTMPFICEFKNEQNVE